MRPFVALLLCGLIAGCAKSGGESGGPVAEVSGGALGGRLEKGAKSPDFSIKGSDGKTHTLASLTEKGPAFLYFIKHDCSGNPAAVPLIAALAKAYAGKATFVGVTNGDQAEAEGVIREYGLPIPLLLDKDKKLIKAYGLEESQHTYQVGPGGTIQQAFHGYGKESLTALNQALAQAAGVAMAKVDLSGAPDREAFG